MVSLNTDQEIINCLSVLESQPSVDCYIKKLRQILKSNDISALPAATRYRLTDWTFRQMDQSEIWESENKFLQWLPLSPDTLRQAVDCKNLPFIRQSIQNSKLTSEDYRSLLAHLETITPEERAFLFELDQRRCNIVHYVAGKEEDLILPLSRLSPENLREKIFCYRGNRETLLHFVGAQGWKELILPLCELCPDSDKGNLFMKNALSRNVLEMVYDKKWFDLILPLFNICPLEFRQDYFIPNSYGNTFVHALIYAKAKDLVLPFCQECPESRRKALLSDKNALGLTIIEHVEQNGWDDLVEPLKSLMPILMQ